MCFARAKNHAQGADYTVPATYDRIIASHASLYRQTGQKVEDPTPRFQQAKTPRQYGCGGMTRAGSRYFEIAF